MSERLVIRDRELREAAYALAMMALQSDRYDEDPNYRQAADTVLSLSGLYEGGTELPKEEAGWLELRAIERAVWEWQLRGNVHPLTCGTKEKHRFEDIASELNSPTHDILRPDIRGDRVVLLCPTCDYVQTWIPEIVTGGGP